MIGLYLLNGLNSLLLLVLLTKNIKFPDRLKFWKRKAFLPIRHKPLAAPAQPMVVGNVSYYVPKGRHEEVPFMAVYEGDDDTYMIKDGIQAGTKMPDRVFQHLFETAEVARVVSVDQRRLAVAPTHNRFVLQPKLPRFAPPAR